MKITHSQYDDALFSQNRPKEPLLNVPFIIIFLIAFCFFIYFVSHFVSDQLHARIFVLFAFIPVFFKADPVGCFHTVVSYSFMHGSLRHIALNMIWLLVFGSPLVRHLGNLRFLIFWVLTAVASVLTYFIFHQNSEIPLIGASGAIFGMMGAAVRYFFSTCSNSSTRDGKFERPLLSIREALHSRTVLIYLGVWFMINFITGIFPYFSEEDNVSIAWEAHVGGLISGFLLISFFNIPWRKSKITV
ncbi:rhomboid family intramembrane serine protease [Bartonella bacilliformis]|uniref:Peptidase S54 rhomboid domain-containing protein n=1 Tax=Bartonella bacilliformis Ver097 TaxID=1293911 RepID=A0A072R352_BARBA|nr:rhomboid family intramembrane serine protease [Bartonella bacilliformis]KEG20066.1 hypothetical protein H710_00663 [Bartonella bacilliformis Ver097]